MSLNWSIQHKRDTAANWTANNPILLAGQIGFEQNGGIYTQFKVGDGVTHWNSLAYFIISTNGTLNQVLTAGNTTGGKDILVSAGDLIKGAAGNNFFELSSTQTRNYFNDSSLAFGNQVKLNVFGVELNANDDAFVFANSSGKFVQIHGDSLVSDLFGLDNENLRLAGDPNGTAGKGLQFVSYKTGVGAAWGVYAQLLNGTNPTFDFLGDVSYSALTASTVPYLDSNKVLKSSSVTPTQLGYLDATSSIQTQLNARELSANKGAANGYAPLGSDSKIPSSYLPALAITDTFVVASQAAMLALSTAETGDVAIRTDLNKSFILRGTTYSVLADWQELLTPTDAVLSVNGFTGAITLTTTNISEGTNLYFTNARVDSRVSAYTGDVTLSGTTFSIGSGKVTNTMLAGSIDLATKMTGLLSPANGGTGVANNSANTITFTGNYSLGLTLSGNTSITLPTSGTVAVLGTAQTWTAVQTIQNVIHTNNTITASGNAATIPITHRVHTVTNNSAATLTITLTTTSAVDGQMQLIRILDASAVAQTITWVNTENSDVTAPTTSNGSTTLPRTVGFQYNAATSKWRCIANA